MSRKKPLLIPRRAVLQGGAFSLLSLGLDPLFFSRLAFGAQPGLRPKTLVCLFQRGAVDVLNMVVPHAEPSYYADRPHIAVGKPGTPGGALDLNGTFGLHPGLAPLKALFDAKELAIVTATGSPEPTRSHFDAQHIMEIASPAMGTVPDGWLNRCMAGGPAGSLFGGVSFTQMMPAAMTGDVPALVIENLEQFGITPKRPKVHAVLGAAFKTLYEGSDPVASTGRDALEAMDVVASLDPSAYKPENGATYSTGEVPVTGKAKGGEVCRKLKQAAQILKANLGTRIVFLDCGGWDTHVAETGRLAPLLADLAAGITSFRADLGDRMKDVMLLTMSEFGRMVEENGAGGTDHGHGSAMLALGGEVAGGRILGKWPGLDRSARFEGRDLAVTTDYRDVFAEVAAHHLAVTDFGRVFPGFTPTNPAGLFG